LAGIDSTVSRNIRSLPKKGREGSKPVLYRGNPVEEDGPGEEKEKKPKKKSVKKVRQLKCRQKRGNPKNLQEKGSRGGGRARRHPQKRIAEDTEKQVLFLKRKNGEDQRSGER